MPQNASKTPIASFDTSDEYDPIIDGPYYHGHHLYASFGCAVLAVIGAAILGIAILAIAIFFTSKPAGADTMQPHAIREAKIIEYNTKLAQTRRRVALERLKQSRITSFYATVSAYTAIETCGSHCTMANGQEAYYGAVACPRRIALGTLVNIDGLGIFTCADRTAQWVDGRFDVFFGYDQASYDRAKQWGLQTRQITINTSL